MRAAVYHGPRDVRVEDVPRPGPPGSGEIVLDVGLAAMCGTDMGEFVHEPSFVPLRRPHRWSGHTGPMILGHEFVGTVAAVGEGVDVFLPGDRVACGAGVSCGECEACRAGRTNICARYYTIGLHTHGGLADQVRVPAKTCVQVPDGCADIDAVLAQPLAIGVHCVGRARVGEGDSVVVIGVGGIGSLIVAAAVNRRAGEIVAVDINSRRLDIAGRLGATETFDASSGDVASLQGAPIVIEATGSAAGLESALSIVRPGGRVLMVGLQHAPPTIDFVALTVNEVELLTSQAHVLATDLPEAIRLLSAQTISEHVVDRVVDLERVVADGLQAMVDRRVDGKVVVRIGSDGA